MKGRRKHTSTVRLLLLLLLLSSVTTIVIFAEATASNNIHSSHDEKYSYHQLKNNADNVSTKRIMNRNSNMNTNNMNIKNMNINHHHHKQSYIRNNMVKNKNNQQQPPNLKSLTESNQFIHQHMPTMTMPMNMSMPMPMHRHFLLQRKLHTNYYNNDDVTSNVLSNSFYNGKSQNYNYDNPYSDTFLALDASWWFRFDEGVNKPETRRSHHSVLYSFDIDMNNDNNQNDDIDDDDENIRNGGTKFPYPTAMPSISPSVITTTSTINDSGDDYASVDDIDDIDHIDDQHNQEEEEEEDEKEEDTHEQTSLPTSFPSLISTTPTDRGTEDNINSNITTATNNNDNINHRFLNHQRIQMRTKSKSSKHSNHSNHASSTSSRNKSTTKNTKTQEYMIVSGGFTDFDWHTFPVWAYDISAAVQDNNGKWHELTKTTKLNPLLFQSQDEIEKEEQKQEELKELCRNASNNNSNSSSDSNSSSSNGEDLWKTSSLFCSPPSRVGHISVMRNEYLYVFGGLLYNDKQGVFYMEQEPYMYRMKVPTDYFTNPSHYEYNNSNIMDWERIIPNVISPPPSMHTTTNDKNEFNRPNDIVNRGEVRGGYWEKGDKLIIYGGLHVRDYTTLYNHEQQADEALGDVWSYDFQTDTWEMLAPSSSRLLSSGESDGKDNSNSNYYVHPGARTSHSAIIVGDELVIYGGLKKVETYLWDGSTLWDQLDDVWVFNLNTLKWKERVMKESIGRAYQSLVGWQSEDEEGTVIAAFGGFKTITDPVDNQQISYVYGDTLLSFPPQSNNDNNEIDSSIWFVAAYEGTQMQMSTRLEHSAVLSKAYGNMIIWGGRYRGTSEIDGVWSLNVHGENSNVLYMVRTEDDETPDIGAAYVILVTVMLMSMMFTYMCGVLHRHIERNEGGNINIDQVMDPSNGFSFARRNGLQQDIIDTLPLKTYVPEVDIEHVTSFPSEDSGVLDQEGKVTTGDIGGQLQYSSNNNNIRASTSSEQNGYDYDAEDNEDNCCPICLVEYNHGDEIRCLPCEHEFHKACVDPWLTNNASCPACRHSLQDLASLSASTTRAQSDANNDGDENRRRDGIEASRSGRRLPFTLPSLLGHIVHSSRQQYRQRRVVAATATSQSATITSAGSDNSTIVNNSDTSTRRHYLHHIRPQHLQHTSNSGDNMDSNGDLDLTLSYSSSMDLNDHLPPERNGQRGRRFRPIEFSDDLGRDVEDENELHIHGRSRRMRVSGANRQRSGVNRGGNRGISSRLNGRRRRGAGARSPLNDPLQPSEGTMA